MSRIDDAIKRAKAGEEGADVPDGQVFEPAWDLSAEAHGEVVAHRPRAVDVAARDGDPALLRTDEPRPLALFQGFSPKVIERLALPSNSNSTLVEQFRKLAASLHHAQQANGIRTLMVTSAIAGEGKTLTSTNLALTLAESFKRNVLLVDADLRRPSLHEVFQVPNVSGLSDGLKAPSEGKLPLMQITQLLTLLPAGRPDPDPMHSLISDRMKRVLEEAREKFEWVILDTPPVGLLTDANILGQMVDATLLVVRAGRAPYDFVDRAAEVVGRDRIIGVVLNAAEARHASDEEYYYHYHRYYRSR